MDGKLLLKVLERIEAKVDRNTSRLDETIVETTKNTDSLVQHMEQTRLLKNEIFTRVPPLERHVAMWAGAGKTLAVSIPIMSLIAALLKLFI